MPQQVRLRDGTDAWVLRLERTDKATLAAEFANLSEETRRARFLAPVMRLSDSMLEHLVDEVDGVDHVALVLSAETSPDVYDPVALARMVRYPDVPDAADLAVTVKDAWHGRGVASTLLQELVARRPEGVTRIITEVANDNRASLAMLRRLGPTFVEDNGSGSSEVEVLLTPEEAPAPTDGSDEPVAESAAEPGSSRESLEPREVPVHRVDGRSAGRRPRPRQDPHRRQHLRTRDAVCPWLRDPDTPAGPPGATPVDPAQADLESFVRDAPDEPFVMLNLVRYAEGGRELYTQYLRDAAPFVERVGAEVTYFGAGLPSLVPGGSEAWDAVMLVRYPSPRAFLEMVSDPEYAEVSRLRTKALAAAVLQPTRRLR